MPSSHTLPDNPVYAFGPSYDIENMPQQIRIVFDSISRATYQPQRWLPSSLKCCAQHLSDYVAVVGMLR